MKYGRPRYKVTHCEIWQTYVDTKLLTVKYGRPRYKVTHCEIWQT